MYNPDLDVCTQISKQHIHITVNIVLVQIIFMTPMNVVDKTYVDVRFRRCTITNEFQMILFSGGILWRYLYLYIYGTCPKSNSKYSVDK